MSARTIAFESDGLQLSGELLVPEEPRALVVLCHGMPSGSPPDPSDPGYAGLARTVADRGWAAIWFNFRGCRGAPGDFSARGWIHDLRALLDARAHLEAVAALPVAVVGSSLGGATAIVACAGRTDVAAVATLAAPASADELIPDVEAFLHQARNVGIISDPAFPPDPAEWVEEMRALAPERFIARLAPRPVLVVHGDADPTVPYLHGERLYSAAAAPKELVRIPHGGHQLRRDERAIEAVLDWLERHADALSPDSAHISR